MPLSTLKRLSSLTRSFTRSLQVSPSLYNYLHHAYALYHYTVHSETFLFADDTKCLRPIYSPQDHLLLQSDLDPLSNWSKEWKLMFNETKINALFFLSSPVDLPAKAIINISSMDCLLPLVISKRT